MMKYSVVQMVVTGNSYEVVLLGKQVGIRMADPPGQDFLQWVMLDSS